MSQTQNEKHQLELIICAKNILHAHVGFLFIHSFKQKKTIKKNEEIKTKNETNMDTSYLPQFTVGIITALAKLSGFVTKQVQMPSYVFVDYLHITDHVIFHT